MTISDEFLTILSPSDDALTIEKIDVLGRIWKIIEHKKPPNHGIFPRLSGFLFGGVRGI